MAIKVVPSGEEDAEILIPIGIRAFSNDVMNKKIYDPATATPEQNKEHLEWRVERHKRRVRGEGKYYFKAIDEETGAVCGYSAVLSPEADRSNMLAGVQGEGGEKKKAEDEAKLPASTPKETIEFIEQLEGKMKGLKKEALGERKDVWYVPSMAVHPDFQGRGIGLKLIEYGFEIVDKSGQDLYLESTPGGRRLYEKAGFEKLGTLDILDGEYTLTAMLRKPKLQA